MTKNYKILKEIAVISFKFAMCMVATPKSLIGREYIPNDNKFILAAVCLGNVLTNEALKAAKSYYEENPDVLSWFSKNSTTTDTTLISDSTYSNTTSSSTYSNASIAGDDSALHGNLFYTNDTSSSYSLA